MIFYNKKLQLLALLVFCAGILCGAYYGGAFGPHLILLKSNFNHLPNWQQDDQSQALLAFKQSCSKLLASKQQKYDWHSVCVAATAITHPDPATARQFFEKWFTPYHVTSNLNPHGLFTGYYLPLLHGSLQKDHQYSVPVYGVPNDLTTINLALFYPELSGKKIVGRIQNTAIVPYPERSAIIQGAIDGNAPVLVWVDNLVDEFFAQIQGSAIVQLQNQQQIIIGYAGNNGHAYTAIGKVLIEKNALDKKNISMQTIKEWLSLHPDQVSSILNHDASFVFFRILKSTSPLGSEQVPLTAERSLAVDTRYIPLGAPVWLDTIIPQSKTPGQLLRFDHLLIAQDTGGAIKGVVRGDIYCGAGDAAAYVAGNMQNTGEYWILLPRTLSS